MQWIAYALVSVALWGGWAFFGKLSLRHASWVQVSFTYGVVTVLLFGALLLAPARRSFAGANGWALAGSALCGAFGLGSTREQDRVALRRFYECLEPGGTLVLDHEVPYANATRWRQWPKDARRELPEAWPPPGERRRASDGSEYELRARAVALDPLDQRLTLEMHAELWREGRLVAEEEYELTMCLYLRNELLLLLEQAGFADVTVRGDHTDEEATGDHDFLVFVATKPG